MKKSVLFCIFLSICSIVFISYLCYTSTDRSNEQIVVYPSDVFELNLFSDKEVYKTTDAIQIWATLEYTGSDDTLKIWHDEPYINFFITDGKNFTLSGIRLSIVNSSVLEKNEVYHFDYHKSGAWDPYGPDGSFWENFYKEKDLFLPVGEYTITVKGDFYLNDKLEGDSGLLCELKIKVEP